MAVSGLPEPCSTHARNIARLALDMMDLGKSVLLDGKPVVTFFKKTPINFSNIYLEDHNWNTLWRSRNWSNRPQNASVLSFWQHCQPDKSNGNNWRTWKDQRF